VFSGFHTSSSIEEASMALEAARLRYEAEREQKRARVKELAQRLASSQQQPELAERRARLADERRRLADLALQTQRGSVREALLARTEADLARGAAIDAYFNRILLWADLEREAGLLAETLVGEPATATP
jgi:outer membrane protein TolC